MGDGVCRRATARWWKTFGVLGLLAATALASPAKRESTFTTLHSFDGTDGESPNAALIQATDGNLYGTTAGGGANGNFGTVFRITTSGVLETLYSFDGADGTTPRGVVQGFDGNFYGATESGGANNAGTVFRVTAAGTLTTLYNFCSQAGCADGANPAGIILGGDGDFYGMTMTGGAPGACSPTGCGTLFGITSTGVLTTLYSFCSQTGCPNGANPNNLIQSTDRNSFGYGTTQLGGTSNAGTVFSVSRNHGTVQTLHSFSGADGVFPNGVVEALNDELYGTTENGGAHSNTLGGTVFQMTTSGMLTTLYSFCAKSGCSDGSNPMAPPIQATDGNLYGTTSGGGANGFCLPGGCGTVFGITASGTLETLYNFCPKTGCQDGSEPYTALIQDTNGTLYGATHSGGANNDGTIFSLSVSLGPFIALNRISDIVGENVVILGTNLLGATDVSFNGVAAKFEIDSASEITATVPESATTGFVTVTTPSGILKSNVAFQVN
jgi:uncharacterized repeat protein (TIGR03803 family)